ncbi:hypothetical protein J6590_094829, partial [Homalodisca vitripennis]
LQHLAPPVWMTRGDDDSPHITESGTQYCPRIYPTGGVDVPQFIESCLDCVQRGLNVLVRPYIGPMNRASDIVVGATRNQSLTVATKYTYLFRLRWQDLYFVRENRNKLPVGVRPTTCTHTL